MIRYGASHVVKRNHARASMYHRHRDGWLGSRLVKEGHDRIIIIVCFSRTTATDPSHSIILSWARVLLLGEGGYFWVVGKQIIISQLRMIRNSR